MVSTQEHRTLKSITRSRASLLLPICYSPAASTSPGDALLAVKLLRCECRNVFMCSHQQNTNTFLAEMCLHICVIQKCVYSDPNCLPVSHH